MKSRPLAHTQMQVFFWEGQRTPSNFSHHFFQPFMMPTLFSPYPLPSSNLLIEVDPDRGAGPLHWVTPPDDLTRMLVAAMLRSSFVLSSGLKSIPPLINVLYRLTTNLSTTLCRKYYHPTILICKISFFSLHNPLHPLNSPPPFT